jgi:hypothetical protein
VTNNFWLKASLWGGLFLAQIPMLLLYFRRLMHDPKMAWLPLAAVGAMVALCAVRWNKRMELPQSAIAWGLLLFGVFGALGASFFGIEGLAILGFIATSSACLLSHRDGQGRSLYSNSYVLWPLVRLPWGFHETFFAWLCDWVMLGLQSALRLKELPHIALTHTLVLDDRRIYIDSYLQTWLSWPAFVFLALFYSALLRRNWLVAIGNAVSSILWFVVFYILVIGYYTREPSDLHPIFVYSSAFGLIGLLFLATERGLRVLTMPIGEETSTTGQVNPIVYGWNLCFRERKVASVHRSPSIVPWRVVVSWALIVLLFCVQMWQAAQLYAMHTKPVERLVFDATVIEDEVFPEEVAVDYRRFDSALAAVPDCQVHCWTAYNGTSVQTYGVAACPGHQLDMLTVFRQQGWSVASEVKRLQITASDGQVFILNTARLDKFSQQGELVFGWIDRQGRAFVPERPTSSPDDKTRNCIYRFTLEFAHQANEHSKPQDGLRLASFVSAVSQQLKSASELTPPREVPP